MTVEPQRLLCIVNRQAQDGAAAKRWPRFNDILHEAGYSCDLIAISRDHLCDDIASALRETAYRAILGIGGDGTHMAVINALKSLEADLAPSLLPPYLVIPFGTGNNVGKSLGLTDIRRDWAHAIPVLRDGQTRPLDLGTWAGGYFADAISIGLDPDILACRDHMLATWKPSIRRGLHGYGMYAIAGLRTILNRPPLQCEIEVDGQTWYCGSYTNILLNNTRVYGGIFDPTPAASDDDGILDLSLITNRPAYQLACLLSWRYQPTFIKRDLTSRLTWTGLRQTRFRSCRISLEPPASLQVDGEHMGVRQELTVGVEQRAITIQVPPTA